MTPGGGCVKLWNDVIENVFVFSFVGTNSVTSSNSCLRNVFEFFSNAFSMSITEKTKDQWMNLLRCLFCVFCIEKKESPSKQICICCLESLILCFKQFWDLYSMVAFSLTFFSIIWQAFASSRNYMRIFSLLSNVFHTFSCFGALCYDLALFLKTYDFDIIWRCPCFLII